MENESTNIQSKKDFIKYVEQEVEKLDFEKIWPSQHKLDGKLFNNIDMFSGILSEDEIIQIYYNQVIKVLGQKNMSSEQKKRTYIDFTSLFTSKFNLKKELMNKEIMGVLIKQIFKDLPFRWKEMTVVYSTDEEKLQFLKENREDLDSKSKFEIVKSIENDDLKLEKMENENFHYLYKLKIISTLKRDEEKTKLLEELESKYKKNKSDKSIMMITPEDILELTSSLKNKENIKEYLNRMLSIKFIKEDIKDYPTTLPIYFFNNIKDDKLVFELIDDLEKHKIKMSKVDIVRSIKTAEGMSILTQKYLLTTAQKIVLAFKVIKDEEESTKWLKENTNIEEKLTDISQKEYKNDDLELPKDLTIGVELEAEGVTPDNIRQIIRNMSVKKGIFGKWVIKEDRSLNHGTEITSPIINAEKENMNELEYVCDFMNAIGMNINRNCGGHIHYGAKFFEKNLKYWKNFISIWYETEELIYKMSNDVGEELRDGVFEYARKESDNIEKTYPDGSIKLDTEIDFVNLVSNMAPGRYYGLNLFNIENPEKQTIEIRIPNGSINPKVQKENIKFFGKMLSVSKEICTNEKLRQKYEKLKNHELSEEEKVEAFLDLLFEKEEDKKIYRSRWNSVRNHKIFDKLQSKKPTFKKEKFEENEL